MSLNLIRLLQYYIMKRLYCIRYLFNQFLKHFCNLHVLLISNYTLFLYIVLLLSFSFCMFRSLSWKSTTIRSPKDSETPVPGNEKKSEYKTDVILLFVIIILYNKLFLYLVKHAVIMRTISVLSHLDYIEYYLYFFILNIVI